MQKVVHIMLAGPVTDGWTYQDNMLTKYQRKLGYEVTIITSQWVWGEQGELVKNENTDYFYDGVKVIRLPLKGKDDFTKKWKRYQKFYETLEKEKPDVLFVHNVSFADVDNVIKHIKKSGICKVFVDNHSDFSNSGNNFLSKNILHKIVWKRYAQMLLPWTKKFYGVLPARVDWLTDMYGLPKEKCSLLVMGGDDEKVDAAKNPESIRAIREKYGITENDFLIMTGGKIDESKTQTLLLMEAVRNIKRDDIKLIVFGSVVESLKEKVAELSDGNKVQYIGWIQAEESYAYFAAADLVAFPGRHSVYWEQVAALGIPMICKLWPGTTHVDFGGNVVFWDEGSGEKLDTVLERIIQNDFRQYHAMKTCANTEERLEFLYSRIAKRAIDD